MDGIVIQNYKADYTYVGLITDYKQNYVAALGVSDADPSGT